MNKAYYTRPAKTYGQFQMAIEEALETIEREGYVMVKTHKVEFNDEIGMVIFAKPVRRAYEY